MELLDQIGLTKDELQQRVVDTMAQRLLDSNPDYYDSDSREITSEHHNESLMRKLKDQVKTHIDACIADLGSKHVMPKIEEIILGAVLQRTTAWGEKVGTPMTFIEFLVDSAQKYMVEIVDRQGRSEAQCRASHDQFYSSGHNRIVFAVHQHLHLSIETAMKQVLLQGNQTIADGILEVTKAKLAEIAGSMNIVVKAKN